MRKKKPSQTKKDPLYQIFEHHVLTRSYEDSNVFAKEVCEEYLLYLDSSPAHVPFHSRTEILKELESEVQELLIKKMYGCLTAQDAQNYGSVLQIRPGTNTAIALTLIPKTHSEEDSK